jgi:SAM-dependent methyltransferase
MSDFKDHFSGHAAQYSAFRPRWPTPMFAWLAEQSAVHDLAWDCATGSGQAAIALKPFFRQVIATDASREQILQAVPLRGVDYRVEPAEKSSLAQSSVDLLIAAQAFHWFDRDAFLEEAGRVIKPGGLLAVASYQLARVNTGVDKVLRYLWGDLLGRWWPAERVLVDQGLDGLDLPYARVESPHFEIVQRWRLIDLIHYLATWSSWRRYTENTGQDPLEIISADLENAWGDAQQPADVVWPVSLKVCRKPG